MFVPKFIGKKLIINNLPSWLLNDTGPVQHVLSFFPSSPIMSSFSTLVFECLVLVHSHSQQCRKLDSQTIKCIFIGMVSVVGHKVIISMSHMSPLMKLSFSFQSSFHEYNKAMFGCKMKIFQVDREISWWYLVQ